MPTRVKLPSSGYTQNVKATGSNHKPPCLPLWIRVCPPHISFLVDASDSTGTVGEGQQLERNMINISHASFHVYTGHMPGKHRLFHYGPRVSTHTLPPACSDLQRILSSASQHLLCICSVCEGEYAHPGTCEHLEASGRQSCYPSLLKRGKNGNQSQSKGGPPPLLSKEIHVTALREGVRDHVRMIELP